ncbi:MAG: ribokinase [Alphaproteobacteria bacterium]
MTTVFGSINVDLVSRVARIPAPGETVHGSDYMLFPGGKGANQALAAQRAGAQTRMIGAVGDDSMAAIALAELQSAGVDLASVEALQGTTGLALITVDETGENAIVLSPGANARAAAAQYGDLSSEASGSVMFQMEVPFQESVSVATQAAATGARTMLSIAPFTPLAMDQLAPFSFIIVNEHEAAALAAAYGLAVDDPGRTVAALAQRLGRNVVATLGPQGAIAAGPAGALQVAALSVEVVDTTGAGDTFAGTLAAFLDEGRPYEDAMRLAAVAGSLACTKEGAQPSFPQRDEILAAAR